MKTKVLIFLLLFSLSATSQEKKTVWDYPVKPRTEQWATFRTGKQMSDACQIPLEILNTLSDNELSNICLNYPLFIDYIASDDERDGISIIIQNFNGLVELSKRRSGIRELVKIYETFPVLDRTPDEMSKNYHIPYKLPFLELLLCDDIFINQLNEEELVDIEKVALNKYTRKVENSSTYSLHNVKATMLLTTIVINRQSKIKKTDEQQLIIDSFIKNYNHASPDLLTEISKIISNYETH